LEQPVGLSVFTVHIRSDKSLIHLHAVLLLIPTAFFTPECKSKKRKFVK